MMAIARPPANKNQPVVYPEKSLFRYDSDPLVETFAVI